MEAIQVPATLLSANPTCCNLVANITRDPLTLLVVCPTLLVV